MSMIPRDFRERFEETLRRLRESGKPSREALMNAARSLAEFRRNENSPGLWETPPRMATATLDDGWGHGLEVIRAWAEAAGVEVRPLGLMMAPEAVVAACRAWRPHLLGMTMLQFDTEDAMIRIRREIPETVRIVAGGPLFRADPELAKRSGIDFVAADAVAFGEFLMSLDPGNI
jgi:methylmalonyl-CoA mutase cobalamin-binding subunit